MYGENWGVSVTRAMCFPDPSEFRKKEARSLLKKKLWGLIVARSGMTDRDGFSRSILHIWCETSTIAGYIMEVYEDELTQEMKDNVGVIMTIVRPRTNVKQVKEKRTPSRCVFYNDDRDTITNMCKDEMNLKVKEINAPNILARDN